MTESKDTVKEARKLTEDIDKVLKTGGFNVKGWISNEVSVSLLAFSASRAVNVFQGNGGFGNLVEFQDR